MPPVAKRNCSVVLLDVNTKPEFLEESRHCLLRICALKWFQKLNDNTKLILLNTANSDNCLYQKFGKCSNIVEATEVIYYNPKLIEAEIKDVKTGEGNWLLGLTVALEAIKENFHEKNGVMTKQLLFITDFSREILAKEKHIEFVIDQLKQLDVYLFILGPKVKIPNLLNFNDIDRWSKNIEFVDEVPSSNLNIAKRIVSSTKGVICDLDIGEEIFCSYRNHWGLQPWKVPLTIGSELSIKCNTVRFLRKQEGPRIKAVAEDGFQEPWKWHMVEDLNEEVPHDNVIGGVFKHNKFIPLPSDIEQNFKYEGERSFKVIGFTNASNISEMYMEGDGTHYIENDGSKLFPLLLRTLAEVNKCVIAKKCYMKNCKPRLVALLPRIDEGAFLLVTLPYSESISMGLQEQDSNYPVKVDRTEDPAVDAAYTYLQKLDITETSINHNNAHVKWTLSPDLMNDIRLKMLYQRFLKKYLDEEADITSESEVVLPSFVEDVSVLKQFIPARSDPES